MSAACVSVFEFEALQQNNTWPTWDHIMGRPVQQSAYKCCI